MTSSGFLVLDKPGGITSRDAVDRVVKWFPHKTKVGHAGTLDPLATGVLVVAVGQATRLIELVQAMPKMYRTRIVLGATSDTDDADGIVTPSPEAAPVTESRLREALAQFTGEIDQAPPAYSAAHVDGHRAYDLARRGDHVALVPRRVRIDRLDVQSYNWPELELDVHCGKGTYIRSIARDLGAALGVGGYVSALRRLRIGPFTVTNAITLDSDQSAAREGLLPMIVAVEGLPTIALGADESRRIRNGQSIPAPGTGNVAALDEAGALVAIGRIANGVLQPDKVFAAEF
jgi:tRNA pseudouridine55 synthase